MSHDAEARNPAARAFGIVAVDPLERDYRSVLSGMRICQLYGFMLLFEWLIRPFTLALSWLAHGIVLVLALVLGFEPGPAPGTDFLSTSRNWMEVPVLVTIWLVFLVYSDFRPLWAVLIPAVAALGHNLYMAYGAFILTDLGLPTETGGRDVSWAIDLFAWSFVAGLFVFHLFFLWIAVRGQMTIHGLGAQGRQILSEYRPGLPRPGAAARALVNIPAAIRYSGRKIVTGILMMVAGVANCANYWRLFMVSIFLCLSPYMFLVLFPSAGPAISALWRGEHVGAALKVLGLGLFAVVLTAVLLLSIPWFVSVLGRLAIRLAQRFMSTSLQRIQHEDPRPPVLFLRSFLNDQVALPHSDLSAERWLLDGFNANLTLDYLVLAEGTAVGPTVALGNPDDPAPPYGVARGYFTHDTWQDAVADLCRDSSAIIMVLDTTEGVKWEIGHIVGRGYLGKSLFLLAPGDVGTEHGTTMMAEALARLTRTPEEEVRARLAAAQGGAPMGFQVGRSGEVELLATTTASAYAYLVATRRFFRLLMSEEEVTT